MKYNGYLLLCAFTFAIGVSISPIRFTSESIACGSRNSSTSYRSSYLIQTTAGFVHYDSEAEASDAFNQKLSEAVEVYDRAPKVNQKGELIDQRAVALFYHAGTGEYCVHAFWREGTYVRSIISRSYIHVTQFEKQRHYF
jgi:hypothetical protein